MNIRQMTVMLLAASTMACSQSDAPPPPRPGSPAPSYEAVDMQGDTAQVSELALCATIKIKYSDV